MSEPVHPVDEVLPLPKLGALGLQHVLVMYANAVAVPLIIGGALHLPKDQLAMLINADLFACGIATLIQTVGFGPFGIRLPIIMGVTAVSISPMLAMAAMPGVGLTGIYGAVLVGGIFGLCVAPFVRSLTAPRATWCCIPTARCGRSVSTRGSSNEKAAHQSAPYDGSCRE